MKKETKAWLERAEKDFGVAEFNLEGGRTGAAMFFCHQAAEKALKALSIEETGQYDYSHDLIKLSRDEDIDDSTRRAMATLNPFYTGFRYPDEADPAVSDPEGVLKEVGRLLEWTRRQLSK